MIVEDTQRVRNMFEITLFLEDVYEGGTKIKHLKYVFFRKTIY